MKISSNPEFFIGQTVQFKEGADFLDISENYSKKFVIKNIISPPCKCNYLCLNLGIQHTVTSSWKKAKGYREYLCLSCKTVIRLHDPEVFWINSNYLQDCSSIVVDTKDFEDIDEIISKFFPDEKV